MQTKSTLSKYDISEVQDYFQGWSSPKELSAKLKTIALDMSLYYFKANHDNIFELREHLECIKEFVATLDLIEEKKD